MTSTNKGNYSFCYDCKHLLSNSAKYPCSKSHKEVRGEIKYERDFTVCLKRELTDGINR